MNIRNFVHKGLKKLYLEDSAKGLPPDAVDKLRAMLTFLQDIETRKNCARFPCGKPTSSPETVKESGVCMSRATGAYVPDRGRRDIGR